MATTWTPQLVERLAACSTEEDYKALSAELGLSVEGLKRRKREKLGSAKVVPTVEERIESEKVKLERAFTQREEAQLIKRAALVENIVDSVREAITVMPAFEFEPIHFGDEQGDEETAVLILSDVHVGKKSRSYGISVFEERMDKLIAAVQKFTLMQRAACPVKRIVVVMDGDMVDGEGIYPTQAFHVEQSVLNQIFRSGIPKFVEFLTNLSLLFEEVEVHCVRGNHGRVGKFAEETSNWDIVFYETLRLAMANNPRVTWDITHDWKKFVDVMGMRFLVVHGHQIKSVLNIPWYGVTTKIMRWAGSVGDFECLIMGHYHTRAYADWNDQEFIMNGTFVTDDEFAAEVVGMKSSTMQTMIFVHPRKKISAYHRIGLNGIH